MEIKKLPYEFESTITPQEFLEKCKSIYPAYTGEESRNLRNIFVSPTQQ